MAPWRRYTARVLPVDAAGRVLLLHGWDPRHPDRPFWFTIGGAAEAGESLRDAGARELREETGLDADPLSAYARSGYGEKIIAERVGGTPAGWGS